MSGRQRGLAIGLGVLFGALLVAAVAMAVVCIWSADERWGETALVLGGVGLIGALGTATYPGWDW